MNDRQRLLRWVFLMILSLNPVVAYAEKCGVGKPHEYTSTHDLAQCPADIQRWMDLVNECAYLLGEISGNRSPQVTKIQDRILNLGCHKIPCDYHSMLEKYRGNGVLTDIITEFKDFIYGAQDKLFCDLDK